MQIAISIPSTNKAELKFICWMIKPSIGGPIINPKSPNVLYKPMVTPSYPLGALSANKVTVEDVNDPSPIPRRIATNKIAG